jgi:hypothetical protein
VDLKLTVFVFLVVKTQFLEKRSYEKAEPGSAPTEGKCGILRSGYLDCRVR